jgi:hypothetical protein
MTAVDIMEEAVVDSVEIAATVQAETEIVLAEIEIVMAADTEEIEVLQTEIETEVNTLYEKSHHL